MRGNWNYKRKRLSNYKNELKSKTMKSILLLFLISVTVYAQVDEQKFLSANKNKNGITTTASGLQYEIIKQGNGQKPTLENEVKFHHLGTRLDGTVLDDSFKKGEPLTLPVNVLIKGWQEGLQLMPTGSRYRFYIPSKLAYGIKGSGVMIKPNETLIFEIELLEIIGVKNPNPVVQATTAINNPRPVYNLEGLVPFQIQEGTWNENALWGLKDRSHKIIVAPFSEEKFYFVDGYSRYKITKKYNDNTTGEAYGIIDNKGKIVMTAGEYSLGKCKNIGGGYFFTPFGNVVNAKTAIYSKIKLKGADYIEIKYSGVSDFFITSIKDTVQINSFNKKGLDIVIVPTINELINSDGKVILPLAYKKIEKIDADLLRAQDFKTKKYGIINQKGEWALQPKYDEINEFSEGLSEIEVNYKHGYINTKFEEVIEPKFTVHDVWAPFKNGYACLSIDYKEIVFINKKGETVLEFGDNGIDKRYKTINDLFIVQSNYTDDQNWYVYDTNAKQVIIDKPAQGIETIDGKKFVYLIDKIAYTFDGTIHKKIELDNVSDIMVWNDEVFEILSYITTDNLKSILLDKNLNIILKSSGSHFYENKELKVLERYRESGASGEDVFLTYVDYSGKAFTEVKK
jgi:FKBP-type peptidyl-prolyl cis-trans isomerase